MRQKPVKHAVAQTAVESFIEAAKSLGLIAFASDKNGKIVHSSPAAKKQLTVWKKIIGAEQVKKIPEHGSWRLGSTDYTYQRHNLGKEWVGFIAVKQGTTANDSTSRKMQLLFDILPVGVGILDQNNQLIEMNPALQKIVRMDEAGLQAGKYRNRKYFDGSLCPLKMSDWPSAMAKAKEKPVIDREVGIETETGDIIWTSVSASFSKGLKQTITVTRDITAEKNAVYQLKQREEFFHTILDALPGMVGYWTKGLICRYANAQYLEWFGRTSQQMLGIRIQDLMGPELFAKNKPYIEGALAGKPQLFERRLDKPDGSFGWTSARYVPHIKSGKVEGFFVLVTDVTDLYTARQNAEKASEAKSHFLTMLSHELRTPLNGILGTLDLLDSGAASTEQKNLFNLINQSASLLLRHIESLLQYARLEADKAEIDLNRVSLHEIILQTVASTRSAYPQKRNILRAPQIDKSFPDRVITDGGKISQILINLLGNAMKYTESGSIDTICSAERGAGKSAVITFTVRDTGLGIAKQDLGRIFSPYGQVKPAGNVSTEGLGLGLAITEKLVHLLKGSISVESRLRHGSTFTVTIPVEIDNTPVKEKAAPDNVDLTLLAVQRPAEILIVDDNPLNIMLFEQMLKKLGYTPITADNGKQAFRYATRSRFDLILMDIQMPDVDGISLTRAIRNAAAPKNPVIVAVTADATEENRAACFRAGMDDFVTKPVRLEDLVKVINMWIPERKP